MRKAFTLIELLVIIGIMASMVTMSVISVRAGQGAARVRGAARDIFAAIRHARSMALLSQQPVVITYSCEEVDGEPIAKIEVHAPPVLDTKTDVGELQTISGEPLKNPEGESFELVHIEGKSSSKTKKANDAKKSAGAKKAGTEGVETEDSTQAQGQGIEDILFAQISEEVVRGMRIKVTMGEEALDYDADDAKNKSKISVFSNVDYLLGKFKESQKIEQQKKEKEAEASGISVGASLKDDKDAGKEKQEPVSIVWETNGRVEPHRVWVYADGEEPEKGLSIKIDRYGAAKVLGTGEEDDK